MIGRRHLPLSVALLLSLTGCGYHAGALIPPDVKSIHVAIFDNHSFRHEIEIPLSRAIKNEVARRTYLEIKPAGTAGSILTGAITRVDSSVATHDANDQVATQQVTVHVRFEWRRRGSRETIASSADLSSGSQLIVSRGESQSTATEESFRDLAELIVERMQEDF